MTGSVVRWLDPAADSVGAAIAWLVDDSVDDGFVGVARDLDALSGFAADLVEQPAQDAVLVADVAAQALARGDFGELADDELDGGVVIAQAPADSASQLKSARLALTQDVLLPLAAA